ncbi:activating transcription factor of chaperone-like [Haliotis rubra]|uniref:activating transcription factor of chaperone-like n=1 Tax=Haliotis rubra TaxID=36100 RepID=UPI001EE4F64A|nr:activating transcription factor of chaperone-like [Haliotis rubra]
MTSTLNMEDLNLLSEDWQLEPSLGLTLFDDPWKNVDFESTDIVKTPLDSGVDDLSELLGAPTEHIADPFCNEWMENAGITEMLQSLVQDSASAMDASSVPETLWEAADTSSEVKGHEILRSLIEQGLEPESTPPSPEAQVAPTIDLGTVSLDSSIETPMSPIHLTDMDGIMHSPLSAEDVESLLSGSEPSSPDSSSTVDSASGSSTCSELQAMLLDNTPKSNGKSRIRSSPYSKSSGRSTKSKVKDTIDSDIQVEFLSKKDKKKLQNKNAAIRYRHKKKAEAEEVKTEEQGLEEQNKELRDKVDQLAREIQYMKDLMAEVLKAKGVKS